MDLYLGDYLLGDTTIKCISRGGKEFLVDSEGEHELRRVRMDGFGDIFFQIKDSFYLRKANIFREVKFIEGEEVINNVLSNFKSGYLSGFNISPEKRRFPNSPFFFAAVPDNNLCTEDKRYGAAFTVSGKVCIDEDNHMWGGKGEIFVFAEEIHKSAVELMPHDCKGMIYDIDDDGDMTVVDDFHGVRDVNMVINAISNFQLQAVKGGGLFGVNKYLVESYEKLFKNYGFRGTNVKKKIAANLYSGFKYFVELYNEAKYSGKQNTIPLDSILMKVDELFELDPEIFDGSDMFFIKDELFDHFVKKRHANTIYRFLHHNPVFFSEKIDELIGQKFSSCLASVARNDPYIFKEKIDLLIENSLELTLSALVSKEPDWFEDKVPKIIEKELNVVSNFLHPGNRNFSRIV